MYGRMVDAGQATNLRRNDSAQMSKLSSTKRNRNGNGKGNGDEAHPYLQLLRYLYYYNLRRYTYTPIHLYIYVHYEYVGTYIQYTYTDDFFLSSSLSRLNYLR